MFTKDANQCIAMAKNEATIRGHEHLRIEHLLYSILLSEKGRRIIERCGGDTASIQGNLEAFFEQERKRSDVRSEIQLTMALQRILNLSNLSMVQPDGQTKNADLEDLLVSIHREANTHASHCLTQGGVSRTNLLNYIQDKQRISLNKGDLQTAESPLLKRVHLAQEAFSDPDDELNQQEKSQKEFLSLYTVNLSQLAKESKLDALIGRKLELEHMIHILCRRRKNNPILVGEPGVGKTALAEGIALKIHEKSVPKILENCEVFSLDVASLIAGTKYRGEFEQRMKQIMNALESRKNIILMIDEIHSIVGAGTATNGVLDIASFLKPNLARGGLRCIGATTYSEYKVFSKDKALSRRFQKIDINEPSFDETIEILSGVKAEYESFHKVKYSQKILQNIVEFSNRYLNDRFLPDKAIDVLDESGAFAQIQLGQDQDVVDVEEKHVLDVISKAANIEVNTKTTKNDFLMNLEADLKQRIFGQDESIEVLVTSIKRSKAGLGEQRKPIGCFLMAGPTGVGKTELAKQLASLLNIRFQRFDMSEYMEKHSVSRLIGSPPGYVGFEQGGLLVDGVRKFPNCVLLLDEIEKAHPDIFNILLQVMDHASLTDHNGTVADFSNVILLMTSNVGATEMSSTQIGFGKNTMKSPKHALEKGFTPEFRNRLDKVLYFNPLSQELILKVVDKFINQLRNKLQEKLIVLELTTEVKEWIAKEGYSPEFGARPIQRLIQEHIESVLADEVLFGNLADGGHVQVSLHNDELSFHYQETRL